MNGSGPPFSTAFVSLCKKNFYCFVWLSRIDMYLNSFSVPVFLVCESI